MSKWITDRRPTFEDADDEKSVWTMCVGKVVTWGYGGIREGQPWMPTNRPKPYVKPKRWKITTPEDQSYVKGPHAVYFYVGGYVVMVAERIPTIEAAERIAAIYEEVMP